MKVLLPYTCLLPWSVVFVFHFFDSVRLGWGDFCEGENGRGFS
jgi:hypothetical protein